eukprot:TRINITY_DN9037_c0_g1_i1.p1 TRINITY_DN9037_c0_g1~~TRINITY_DN9037_c0_g1_i1.p1  ORF type:complete len:550 (+),score=57.61 TRINITY_DN9037_c0_g1_i1:39-1688(+)
MSHSLENYHEIRQLSQYRTREIDSTEAEHYVTGKDERGMLCIHWAMLYQDSDIIGFLLRAGADINAQTENGFTPLHLALLKNDNHISLKHFKEDKYYTYFMNSSVLYRLPEKLKTILTSLQQPKVDLKDNFGLNPILTALFFRDTSTTLALINSIMVPPRVIIDYILASSYSYLLPSATSKRAEKFRRVLAAQAKHGILPRNANFLAITEPQNIHEITNLLYHSDLQLYILDVTVGLPNSLFTFFLLIEKEGSFLMTRDLSYKAIQESLPELIFADTFSWVPAMLHLNLTKYLRSNYSISSKVNAQIRNILDYTDYLSVFIDLKLFSSTKPNEVKILDSLLHSTISLLIVLWLEYRDVISYSDLRVEIRRVANSLNKLSAKYGRSIYHWILSCDYLRSFSRTDGISFLLENDFDCNIRTKEANGSSVLSFAYNKRETGVCLLLLRHGAYPLSVDRFEVSFMDEVVKCTTVLPFVKLRRLKINQSNEFIRAISRDPVLKNIWVNFSRLPYKLSTLTAQRIVEYNLPYSDLTSSLIAFVKLHDPKKYECWK